MITSLEYLAWSTASFWRTPSRPTFHHLVATLTAQQVPFHQGRKIRQNFYKLQQVWTPDFFATLSDATLQKCGLSPRRCVVLRELIKLYQEHRPLSDYQVISGVGPWTIKSVELLELRRLDICLYEDKWVQKRVAEWLNIPTISPAQLHVWLQQFTYASYVSHFFWRIQPSGIQKMRTGKVLTRDDFV